MNINKDEFSKNKNINIESGQKLADNFLMDLKNKENLHTAELFKKRLNAFDSTLFEESSIEKIDDPSLKLENKIEQVEEILEILNEKLIVAETIQDNEQAKKLFIQKKMFEKKLQKLQNEYKSKSIDTKLTQGLISFFGIPENIENDIKNKVGDFVQNSGIAKPFQPITNFFKIKETLGRLDKINKSVDELVSMRVPFGENEERYQTLANHLTRANYLHNQIEKEFKK